MISPSVSERHSASSLESAILNYGGMLTSGNINSFTGELVMAENVGLALGFVVISHSIPERHRTSSLESAIVNPVSQPTYNSNGQ